ncbi:hypothetical protein OROMI_023470 [Orobanche minor]
MRDRHRNFVGEFSGYCPLKCPSYGWSDPRLSLNREFRDEESASNMPNYANNQAKSNNADGGKPKVSDPEISGNDFIDFEFRLVDPVAMLTADELFSDGKIVPLHISSIRQSMISSHPASSETRSEDSLKVPRRNEISSTDPYLFSPKAPRCTIRWREILCLKKLYQNGNGNSHRTAPSSLSSPNINSKAARSLKHILHGDSKSAINPSINSSLNLPLLKESNNELLFVSGNNLRRLSLDSDKPSTIPRSTQHLTNNFSKVRVIKHRLTGNQTASLRCGRSPARGNSESTVPVRGVSVDSPRMNSYGKIVFQGLERSSSSPSTFNGGPRPYKSRGMERSYSANVRVTPVLNVGVFGLFSTQQKKDSGNNTNTVGGNCRIQQHHVKNRTDRT